jgi:transcriptional regulator with XRE-family HTH domain
MHSDASPASLQAPQGGETPAAVARRGQALALTRLRECTGVELARAMGTSESTVSRIANERLEEVLNLIAHLGLKLVPVDADVYPRERIEILLTLARERMASITDVEQLACR